MAARQLILDLLARDKTGAATKSAAGNLEDVGDAARDAAKSTEKLGAASDRAEDQTEKLGKSARTAAEHVDRLDREIESVERELRQLAVAFAEAESAADRLDLSKAIRRTQSDLRKLNTSRGLLDGLVPKPAEVAAAGSSAGTSFLAGFAQSASQVGPLGPVAAGMGLYLAPLLGANVAAGVLGGAGAGGVIGGLALASRDSRVKAAAKSLGEDLLASLDKSAGAFVPAMLAGINQIRAEFKKVDKDLTSIFDNSARFVKPLITGLSGLVEGLLDGVEKAVAGAQPVIDALARNLPRIGDALGDVFADLSDNGPEAAVALGQLFDIIEIGVRTVGVAVNGLTELYGLLAGSGVLGTKAQQEWIAYKVAADAAAVGSSGLAGQQQILADKTEEAAKAAKEQEKAIRDANAALRATIDPLFGFLDAQDQVTEKQKALNEVLKKHKPNSAEAAAATRDLAAAALDLKERASEVGTTADGKLTPALRRVLEQARLDKNEIAAVERQLRAARGELDKYDGTNANATVTVQTKQAAAAIRAILAQYNKVRDKTVILTVATVNKANVGRLGPQIERRAHGGPVAAGVPYVVGDGGRPEVFVPQTNGRIEPSVAAFARSSSSGGMAAGGTLTVAPSGALDDLERMFLKMLRTRPAFAAAVARYVT